jgi:hypothetical protein
MGKESDQAHPIVENVDTVVSDNQSFIDWHHDGNADQNFSLLNESASLELVNQGMLPTVNIVTDSDGTVLSSHMGTKADEILRADEDGLQVLPPSYEDLPVAATKPHFAGHPDLAGEDVLQVLPPSYEDLPVAATKPHFAGHSDLAGDDQLSK